MKKLLLTIIGIIFLIQSAAAVDETVEYRERGVLKGYVYNKTNRTPVPYAAVMIRGTMIGTLSDEDGSYIIRSVPSGKVTVEVSSIGYASVRQEIMVAKGETLILDLELDEDKSLIDEVVVSANRSETTRRMAPTLVNVLSSKLFENTNACNIASGLSFQPGVRVENNCQNCGFVQVRINGLDGHYSQILIDSRPVFSALSGVYGLEQIPANMIDRVEVIRGGGSALFGSSAIAGIINIITREPSKNSFSISHTTSLTGMRNAWSENTTFNSSIVTEDNKAGLAVFGQISGRDAFDADGDGFSDIPVLNGNSAGLRSFLKTGEYSKLTFEYHHLGEYRRGGDQLSRPPHEAEVAEQTRHDINSGNLKFDLSSPDARHRASFYASAQKTDRESYYGAGKDLNAYGATKNLTWVAGAQYNYKFDRLWFMPAELSAGAEYNQDRLNDDMWGYGRRIEQIVGVAGAFFQNEWKNEKLSFLIGGRADKNSLLKNVMFSPRLTARYNPVKDVNLRASYSYGFRAPQAFDEDLHIEAVGGTVAIIRLADDLEPEQSRSLSLSADLYKNHGLWQTNLLVEGFYTRLSDAFALREKGKDASGNIIRERYNESGANVYGVALEGKAAYGPYLSLQAGLTLQKAEYFEARAWSDTPGFPAEKRMFRTPDVYGYFIADANPTGNWDLTLSGNYTGPMLVEHHSGYISEDRTEKTRQFVELNFKTCYDFKIYKDIVLEVNAGVQNIFNSFQKDFDKGKDRDSGYIYGPMTPRTVFAGIKISY